MAVGTAGGFAASCSRGSRGSVSFGVEVAVSLDDFFVAGRVLSAAEFWIRVN